jgi:hypothetical protein
MLKPKPSRQHRKQTTKMSKIYRIIITLSLLLISASSVIAQYNPKISRKTKTIKLNSSEIDAFFAYENSVSIIYLDKYLIQKQILKHLENKRLCDLRRINYSIILNRLSNNDSSLYVIEPTLSPHELGILGMPEISTSTGYGPLDYYASKLKKSISTEYIAPYGFTIELETVGKIHLPKYFDWMISELVLEGKAKVYNKEEKKFENRIIFEKVSFEGHGGETLLFQNGKSFFDVETYTDIVIPDYECGDDYDDFEEIE